MNTNTPSIANAIIGGFIILLGQFARTYFEPGILIFEKGDEGNCAYLVESGEVEISNPLTGFIFTRVSQGALFGEIALIDHQPRTASARASQPTTLIKIDRLLIDELLRKTDPIIQHLLSIATKRLRSNVLPSTLIDLDAKQFPDELQSVIANLANQKLALMQDLNFALSSEQFVLHYQPIHFLKDEKIAGFEALIRWKNPKMGLLPPLEFLGMAEETGLIHQIGLWVVHRACCDWKQLKTLSDSETPFLNINVSGRQLIDPAFAAKVIAIQNAEAVQSSEIKFELTETTLIENPELAHVQLKQLTDHGNAIILDDYGVGYSGLGHLQRYNFSGIKLDQSFIKEMLHTALSLQLVISSIEMATKLQLEVVAEGIETREIAQALTLLGCTLGQGFLFRKAKPLDELLGGGFNPA